MAVIGTFSSFTTARLGLYASQASLNITGNNIANINTEGYTRQRLDLVSLYSKGTGKYANIFNTNIGYGVLTQSRSQLRDPFLDIRYRNENTNLAANTETYNGLYQISHTLDEVNKGTDKDEGYGVIQANLKNFVTALNELHKNVGSPEFDREVRGQAESLCTFFKEAATALQSVFDGKEEEFTQNIKETNLILTDIRDLNEQIRTAALYGDNALELRDQRNMDLDKLSELMHINVEYSMERVDQFTEVEKLTVTIAGSKGADGKPIKLIDGIYGAQISLQEEEPLINPDYDPVAINKAKTAAAEQAKKDNPVNEVAIEVAAKELAKTKEFLAKTPMESTPPWKEQLDNAAKAAAEADPDYANLSPEDQAARIEAKKEALLGDDGDEALKAKKAEIEENYNDAMVKKAYKFMAEAINESDIEVAATELAKTEEFLAKTPMESTSPWKEQLAAFNRKLDAAAEAAAAADPEYTALGTEAEQAAWIEAKKEALLGDDGDEKLKAEKAGIEKDYNDAMVRKAYNQLLAAKNGSAIEAAAKELAKTEEFLAKTPMESTSPWKEQLAAFNRKLNAAAEAAAKADDDYANLSPEDQAARIEEKKKDLLANDEKLKAKSAEIEADYKEKMERKAYNQIMAKANAAQQAIIDKAAADKEAEEVAKGGKYYNKNYNPDEPISTDNPKFTNQLYVLDEDTGLPVQNEDGTHQYNVKTRPNEKYLLQVEPLMDRRERLMIEPNTVSKKSEVVELNDTVLYGKLQSQRELLTEEGEYASEDDLNKNTDPPLLSGDPDAAIKRGIPYYQKALDSLARQFAEEFNQANQLPATTVYQTMDVVVDADGKLVPDGDPDNLDADQKTVSAFISSADPAKPVTTVDGKVITADDVTKVVTETVSRAKMEEKEQQKLDENGNPVVDGNGDPVMEIVKVPVLDEDGNPVMEDVEEPVLDENGKPLRVPYDMHDDPEQYAQAGEMLTALSLKAKMDPLYEFYDGGVLFSNNGNTNDPSGITAANITISNAWSTETVHILNDKRPDTYREDGTVIKHSSRNENIDHMISLFEKQLDYEARDLESDSAATLPIFKGSFQEVYTTIEDILGTDQNITAGKMNNYAVMTLSLENDRQSVSGVDLNDEATSMMQYSKSYSAACRLLTTIDQMLDTLINGTAR